MAHLTLAVPAALVPPLRDSVVLLYGASTEGLHLELQALAERRGSPDDLRAQRRRQRGLDELLDQLRWPDAPPPGELELHGPAELLGDALYGALIDSGERLSTACSASWSGEATLEDVAAAAEEVMALDRLLRVVRER
jgi:hypothetical protein